MLKEREERDEELFQKIINNPKPDILDLWSLSEEKFIEWRRRNDYPILLNHFDKVLPLFKEWKDNNKLTNEIIIESGFITPFIEKKRSKRKKSLFLTKQFWNTNESLVVKNSRHEGKHHYLGTDYRFEFILEFTSYLDWLATKGQSANILYINSRHSSDTDAERVFIHADVYANKSDFELLKMGGIEIPVTDYNILNRGKIIEFANLSGLKLTGKMNFGELGNLSCYYCACDRWLANNFSMPMIELNHCSVSNFTLFHSKLQQWKFYDCIVNGDFFNTKLYSTSIIGGSFAPVIQDSTLSDTHIFSDPNIVNNNFSGYRMFKKIYQNQGDDDIAKAYFIKENEFIRSKSKGLDYITKSLSYFYWEYGRKPHRIIYFSLAIILLFGFIFWLGSSWVAFDDKAQGFSLWDGLYFSTITFTTLGYGDYSPTGWLKILCAIEAFSGVVNMGFIIAGYSNNKY